jgi:hypothetical protein
VLYPSSHTREGEAVSGELDFVNGCEWCGRRTPSQFVRIGFYVCWPCKLRFDLALTAIPAKSPAAIPGKGR